LQRSGQVLKCTVNLGVALLQTWHGIALDQACVAREPIML